MVGEGPRLASFSDSKSGSLRGVRVRVPPPVLLTKLPYYAGFALATKSRPWSPLSPLATVLVATGLLRAEKGVSHGTRRYTSLSSESAAFSMTSALDPSGPELGGVC